MGTTLIFSRNEFEIVLYRNSELGQNYSTDSTYSTKRKSLLADKVSKIARIQRYSLLILNVARDKKINYIPTQSIFTHFMIIMFSLPFSGFI